MTDVFSALTAALTPSPDTLSKHMQDLWLPDIVDPALRDDMWRNPRLTERLLDEVYLMSGIDRHDDIAPFAEGGAVLSLLEQEFEWVLRRLGLAWNANRLLATATSGQLQQYLPGVTREEVRQTVAYRDLALDDKTAFDAPNDPITDGRQCLVCWLATLPPDVSFRVALMRDLTCLAAPDPTQADARATLTDAFLMDLSCMQEAAQ